jgi:uncharacterized protein
MEYRLLGRTGFEVSAVGLGTEYLINQPKEKVARVIHEALARGVNYFDLFFAQPQFRDNMGAAFAKSRDKAVLAAHLGAIEVNGQYDKTRDNAVAEKYFLDFLKRYKTDYVDVLYVHNCDEQADYDKVMSEKGLLGMAKRFRKEGKARSIAFSGHTVATSLAAVESGEIDCLMFSINLAGNAVPGKKDLFAACVRHDVGLVSMKPYAGGKLLADWREDEMNMWLLGGTQKKLTRSKAVTPVQCISYVLAQVGVSTVVPGCKDLDELAAALAWVDATSQERDFSGVVADFKEYVAGECVYCNHCLPCPSNIDIGQTIRLYETAKRNLTGEILAAYDAMPAAAADCGSCGACVERCPFGVDAAAKMAEAAEFFASINREEL